MSLKKIIDLDLLDRFLAKVKELIPTKTSDLVNDSRYMVGMTILSYGKSTWADFMEAYGDNKVVYCRASSNSNPASGSQTRMAFMAYVNNQTTPTEVEFQYYRSVNVHTDSQQGDQVYVYKLNKNNGWSVIVRNAFSKLAVGTGLTHTYSNGTITIDNSEVVPGVVSTTANGLAPQLPNESTTTKFLRQDATWAVPPDTTYESKAAASGGTDVSLVTTGEKYIWNTKELPSGGSAGQVLKKSSATDYSVEWGDASGGGGNYVTFTVNKNPYSCTADKTYQQIKAGLDSGEIYFALVKGDYFSSVPSVWNLSSYTTRSIIFTRRIDDSDSGANTTIRIEDVILLSDGNASTVVNYQFASKPHDGYGYLYLECDDDRQYQDSPSGTFSISPSSDIYTMSNAYEAISTAYAWDVRLVYGNIDSYSESKYEIYHLVEANHEYAGEFSDQDKYTLIFRTLSERNGSPVIKKVTAVGVDEDHSGEIYFSGGNVTVTYSEIPLATSS